MTNGDQPDRQLCPIHRAHLTLRSYSRQVRGLISQDPIREAVYQCSEPGCGFWLQRCPTCETFLALTPNDRVTENVSEDPLRPENVTVDYYTCPHGHGRFRLSHKDRELTAEHEG